MNSLRSLPVGFGPLEVVQFFYHTREKRPGGSPIDGQWWQIAHKETDNWPFCSSWYWIIIERSRTTTGCVFCKHLSGLIPGGRPLSGKCTGVSRKYPNDVLWHYDQVELNFTSLQTVDLRVKAVSANI